MQKLSKLRRHELSFAARAWLFAPGVELLLATAGFERTMGWVERLADLPRLDLPGQGSPALEADRARRLIDAVYRWHLVRGRCLPRSLLQYGLQRHAGSDARLVLGVRKGSSPLRSELDAHAWVEVAHGGPDPGHVDFDPIFVSGSP